MLWRKRYKSRVIVPVAGILLALFWVELTQNIVSFKFIPSLFTPVEAAVASIDPDGDVIANTGTRVTCTGAATYEECLDDGARDPTAPSTAGDYIDYSDGDQTNSTMGSITSVDTVTAIDVKVYHEETRNNMTLSVSLWDATGATQYGTTQALAYQASPVWETSTFSGLSLNQTQIDGLVIRLSCARSGGPARLCRGFEMYADVTYTELINVTVSATSSQQDVNASTTDSYVGGAFVIEGTNGTRNITSIEINETGTIDAANDLKNIKLFYDLSTTTPFDCSTESYTGDESQFGSTDANGFSAANGLSTFTGSVSISPTQTMCVYPVMDVIGTVGAGDTIEIQITDPTTDVAGSGSPLIITPATAVALASTTIVRKTILKQENYHWRNDDGSESAATSATGGSENTTYDTFPKATTKRLRVAVAGGGNKTSDANQYRLEYTSKVSTCALATGWVDVDDVGGDFDMSSTVNLTDGNNTTDIATSTGGVTNINTTFLTSNGGVKDTSSQTSNITLTSSEFVELEYAIEAASGVSDGTTYCFRVTASSTPLDTYINYPEATIAADILVSSIGSLVNQITVPTTTAYAGGTFVFTDLAVGTNSITSITVTASGTVDAQAELSNIRLRYDLDTSSLYDCGDQSYNAGDTQYGGTLGSFSATNTAVFTGSVDITTTQTLCLYLEYDATSTIADGTTLELSIENPSVDIISGSASVSPTAQVSISSDTTFASPFIQQTGYHWRNNDGNETSASSATDGDENTLHTDFPKTTGKHLRFGIANTGLADSSSNSYRLEWTQKVTTCGDATGWERIDTVSDVWEMSPTANLTNNADTTNITATSTGAITDGETFFLSSNGGVKDTDDTTNGVVLPADNFLELEYAIRATVDAVQGATYCFRVTNAGAELDVYQEYAEATIKLDTDFRIQRGFSTLATSTITISAGTEYEAPSSSSTAFIRITNTQLTGAGPNTGNGNNAADEVTAYIVNPENITSSITFQRGAFAGGNTRIAWEIVEYTGVPGGENEIIVRSHQPLTYVSGNTTVSSASIATVVDDADAAVFITSQYNPDTGRNSYDLGLSTADWNTSTTQVDLTRGASGNAAIATYALVEFTGSNWQVQRSEFTYVTAGATSTQAISPVNSLSRAFLHVQKRTAQNNHADFGHEVWLSGIGQVSYLIDAAASTPANHTSVAWVIENTQTSGSSMVVTRSNDTFPSAGSGPEVNNVNIGKTLSDITIASLFTNNRSDETSRSWPEPILSARIISPTQYELWRSDTTANIAYRSEVVEWPTAARKLEQNYYRLYVDNNALLPTDPWPTGVEDLGENEEMTAINTPMALSDTIRIRMTLSVKASTMPVGLDAFSLEYAERDTTCSAISSWTPLGDIGSTTALWRGVNNTPADGTNLSVDPPTGGDLLISIATVAGTYEEENITALNPFTAFPLDELEFDWVVQHNGAKDKTSYCFRMVESTGAVFDAYNFYPVLRTVGYGPQLTNWRWYGDEGSVTPTISLATENTAPIDIQNQDSIKLRLVLAESSGATGIDTKFSLQFSEYSDFSQGVFPVQSITECVANSLWCYSDGAGVDNAIIDGVVISDADSCVSGVGDGCGVHNEATSTPSTFDHTAFTNAEFEFTIVHAGARANAVYYFRLFDEVNSEQVPLNSTSTYPSLVTEGASLTFTVQGLPSGTSTAGIVTDATTTATSINFSSLLVDTEYEAAHRISVDTNATEGYQVLKFASQQLMNSYGTSIDPVTTTNAAPAGWSTGCIVSAAGCFGYHTTDAVLQGGSTRFSATDSYAALNTAAEEIMFSPIPTNDTHDIVYKIRVNELQEAGDYESEITYLAIPTF